MRSLLAREFAYVSDGGRARVLLTALLGVHGFAVLAAGHVSVEKAAYWAFLAPCALAFAHAAALTASDRETGFADLLFTTPLPLARQYVTRWLAASAVGLLAAAFGLLVLGGLHHMGLGSTAVEWRYLGAAPVGAPAAAAAGLLVGLTVGRGSGGSGAVAALGAVLVAGLPLAAEELGTRVAAGTVWAAAAAGFGALSPLTPLYAFTVRGPWAFVVLGAFTSLAALAFALRTAAAQTPSGTWRRATWPRALPWVFMLSLMGSGVLLPAFPPSDAVEVVEDSRADLPVPVHVSLVRVDPAVEGGLRSLQRPFPLDVSVPVAVAVYPDVPLHNVTVRFEHLEGERNGIASVTPSLFTLAEARPRDGPAELWSATLRVHRVTTLDAGWLTFTAHVTSDEGSRAVTILTPMIAKPWSTADELVRVVGAIVLAAVALLVPVRLRRHARGRVKPAAREPPSGA